MLVEYKKLKYGYTAEGWEQAYQNEYKDLQNLRLKLLIEDEAISEVLQDIYKIMLDFRLQGKPINVLDIGCGVGPSSVLSLIFVIIHWDLTFPKRW